MRRRNLSLLVVAGLTASCGSGASTASSAGAATPPSLFASPTSSSFSSDRVQFCRDFAYVAPAMNSLVGGNAAAVGDSVQRLSDAMSTVNRNDAQVADPQVAPVAKELLRTYANFDESQSKQIRGETAPTAHDDMIKFFKAVLASVVVCPEYPVTGSSSVSPVPSS